MKRPKSLPSRRQRALRRGVVLAVFLLAFLAIHRPSITPGQVIRASENLLGLERTEVLAQEEVLSHRVTFSANQDALLLTVYQPLHPDSTLFNTALVATTWKVCSFLQFPLAVALTVTE